MWRRAYNYHYKYRDIGKLRDGQREKAERVAAEPPDVQKTNLHVSVNLSAYSNSVHVYDIDTGVRIFSEEQREKSAKVPAGHATNAL
jgi:hypothetical protein